MAFVAIFLQLTALSSLASYTRSSLFSVKSDTEKHSLTYQHTQMELMVSDVISGPLSNHWVLFLYDASTKDNMNIENVLATIYEQQHSPSMYIFIAENEWEDHLPSGSVLRGRCIVVLVISSYPEWLENVNFDLWMPSALLLINTNASWDVLSLLQFTHIQQITSLTLIEATPRGDEMIPLVYIPLKFIEPPNNREDALKLLGAWSASKFSSKRNLFPDRFRSFQGAVLHVATDYDDYPLVFEGDDGQVDGTNIRILKALGSSLHFSFTTTRRASDNNWGELVDGEWTGLLGEVYHGNKNMTINYFTVVEERVNDFDYTATYFFEGFGFALRIPPPLPAWMSLMYPFTAFVWLTVIVATVLITPAVYLFVFAADPLNEVSILEAATVVFGTLLKQSISINSKSNVVRLVLASWWIGGLILVVSYTCNLIAVLTVPVFPPTISTIEGLAKSNFRVSMVDYGEFVPEALATSKDQYLKALGDRMDLVPNDPLDDSVSYGQLVDLLLEGQHSITETYSYLRNLLADNDKARGKTYMLREQIYQGALAFFAKKNTPWKGKIDEGIRGLVEAGLVDKWYNDIMGGNTDAGSTQKSAKRETSLSLSNLQGPFLLFVVGILTASSMFLLEFCILKVLK